jgi:hypothetical protein
MEERRRCNEMQSWSMEQKRRYNELCILAEEACWVASQDPILYHELMECFQKVISKKDRYGNGEDGSKNSINQDAQTSEGTAAVVGDPIQLSTEGALSKIQKVHFKRTSPSRCSLCHEPGHNIRKCKQNPK